LPLIQAYERSINFFNGKPEITELSEDPETKSITHVKVDLPPNTKYTVGDHIMVLPENDITCVEKLAARLNYNLDSIISNSITETIDAHGKRKQVKITLRYALTTLCEITAIPSRLLFSKLVPLATDNKERQLLTDAEPKYEEYILAAGRTIYDLIMENKSIQMSFETFIQNIPLIKPRQYSISSSPNYSKSELQVSPNKFTLTVGLLDHTTTRGSNPGLCSHYLAKLDKQYIKFMIGQCNPASAFSMTEKHDIPIIMICAGTGIAPFRGFIHERAFANERGNKLGDTVLFYGVKNEKVCPYSNELQYMQSQGVLTKLFMAYSKQQGQPKKYVQNVILENGEYVWDLVANKQGIIYVCGSSDLGKGVREAFLSLAQKVGKLSADNAQKYLEGNQYIEDVWGTH